MIFNGRPVHEITDEEIDALITDKVQERLDVDFKATLYLKTREEKHEILKDIVSVANSGGGYIIVGIRDDGTGRPEGYETDLPVDAEAVKKAIKELSDEYISERLEGLEVVARCVKDHPIVMIRIPNSDRIPRMVTYQHSTGFYRRYHDGKRPMTIGELRDAFSQYSLGQSHDGKIFQESHAIMDEADWEMLLEEIEDDHAYTPEQRERISQFHDFLTDENNRYVHRDIRAYSEALTRSLSLLLQFFDANYYGPTSEGQGAYCLSIYPDSGADLGIEELSLKQEEKWEALHNRLCDITGDIWFNYQDYRRAIERILLL